MKIKEIDSTDIRILNVIQSNARLTHKQIAYHVNKSLSAVQVRMKKLEDSGVIKKFVTLLDRRKVHREMAVFTLIKMNNYSGTALSELREYLQNFDEIMECYHTSGDQDFILKVVVGDMTEYNDFILTKLSLLPHIGSVKSIFAISELKHETAFKF